MMTPSDLHAALSALNQGNHKSALKQARIGMKRHRNAPEFPNVAGIAASSLGKRRDAIDYFQKALKLNPGFHDARRNLAQTLILMGQHEMALKTTARLIKALPKDSTAQYLHAQSQLATGDAEAALTSLNTGLDLVPNRASDQLPLLTLRVKCLSALFRPQQAFDTLEQLLPIAPDPIAIMMDQCRQLHDMQRFDEAHALCNRILERAPDHAAALYLNATQLSQTGQKQACLELCDRMLALDPRDSRALGLACTLATGEQAAALHAPTLAAFQSEQDPMAKAKLCFALARLAKDAGETETANDLFSQANALKFQEAPYDARADQTLFARIKQLSQPLNTASPDPVQGRATPIFVLGQPRSGTTLMERILDTAPDVKGLGELPFLDQLVTPRLARAQTPLSDAEVADIGAGYVTRCAPIAPHQGFFVDKMPENYLFVGFLLAAIPGARVLHMVRDPRDVAMSMWRQDFNSASLTYTFDMAAMAQRANLYRDLMSHWHAQFPGQILDVAYQDLVTDLDGTTRRICSHCGLDWRPEMLSPEKSSKTVKTASFTSVFSKVNNASVGNWTAHAKTLEPLIAGLDPKLWPELSL